MVDHWPKLHFLPVHVSLFNLLQMKNSNIFSLLKTKKSDISNVPSKVISFSTFLQECNLSKAAEMSTTFDIDAYGCSICLEILVEPITMPCKHRMCKPCFAKNLELTNLHCPFCKKRIGTWCRQVTYFLATNFLCHFLRFLIFRHEMA